MTPKPVFISYSTDDTPVTQEIRDGLEAAGIACWMAPRDIVPGKSTPSRSSMHSRVAR